MTADRAAELARPTGSQATTFADVRAASGRRDLPAGEDDWIFRAVQVKEPRCQIASVEVRALILRLRARDATPNEHDDSARGLCDTFRRTRCSLQRYRTPHRAKGRRLFLKLPLLVPLAGRVPVTSSKRQARACRETDTRARVLEAFFHQICHNVEV